MNRAKKLFALALLLLAFTVTGCGNDKEQDAAADRAETGASDTISAGGAEGTGLDVSETDADNTAEEKGSTDFAFTDEWITSIEDGKTELTLIITHHIKEAKTVEFTYQEVFLDGVAAENWEAQGRGATAFTIDPDAPQSFPQTLTLGANIDDYSELTINATANFDDGTGPYPFSVTYRISELERKIEESAATNSGEAYVDEQELYNDNGVIITLTGIEVEEDVEGEFGSDRITLTLNYNNINSSLGCYQVYIGDTLIYDDAWQWENKVGVGCHRDEGTIWVVINGDGLYDQLSEEMEISIVCGMFNLDSGQKDEFGKVLTPKLTIPIVIK